MKTHRNRAWAHREAVLRTMPGYAFSQPKPASLARKGRPKLLKHKVNKQRTRKGSKLTRQIKVVVARKTRAGRKMQQYPRVRMRTPQRRRVPGYWVGR